MALYVSPMVIFKAGSENRNFFLYSPCGSSDEALVLSVTMIQILGWMLLRTFTYKFCLSHCKEASKMRGETQHGCFDCARENKLESGLSCARECQILPSAD
jgi:hypothetical protein